MRNLKRVLSLALALVMVLGMMVITTSAADFTDADEITYTEAVDVMAAIGVIEGYQAADGTYYFDGDKLLTRAEGAALVCYMLMGRDAADKLVGSGNFTDVPADHWAAGEIDYCFNLGFIAGNGDGTFNPGGPLTSIGFGRMLLGALGYDGAIEGYIGSNWASAISSDIIEVGLDVAGVAMDAQLTREAAAQMAFQALTKPMVQYAGGVNITTPDGVVVNSGAVRSFVPGSTSASANWDGATGDGRMQFCERYFGTLKCTATAAAADVIANNVWSINGVPAVTVYEQPAFTFTANLTAAANKTVENTLKGYTVSATTAIEDGTTGSAAATIANIKALTANGVKVDVYTTGKNVHAVTVTNTGLVEITAVNATTGALTLTVRADAWSGALTTSIAKDETDPVYNALAAIGKDGFALVTAAYDGTSAYDVVTVAAPEVTTGLLTYVEGDTTTNSKLTVGGKTYSIAATNDGVITDASAYQVNATTERNLYQDAYGYALYNKNTSTPIVTMPNTIYVAKAYTAADKWGTTVNMAQGVLNDGSVVYVQVASAATEGKLYTYSVSSTTGVYTLDDTNVSDTTTVGIDAVTTAGTTTATTKSADGWYYASDVQFMYISGSGDQLKVEVKDGMQVGQALTTNDWYIIAKDVNNNYVIKTVIIEGTVAPETAEDVIFVKTAWDGTNYVSTKLNSKNATLYGYEGYINGAKTTIWVTSTANTALTSSNLAQGVYTYTVDATNEATTIGSAASYYRGTSIALRSITVIGDSYYWDVGQANTDYDDFDISGATVYDTTGNSLTSAAALKAALTAGKSITVVFGYNSQTETIPVIYVVSCS